MDYSNLAITSSRVISLGRLKLTITVIKFQLKLNINICTPIVFSNFVGEGRQKLILEFSVFINEGLFLWEI